MLLRFTVENWRSFRDPATLSMIATRERQHQEHLSRIDAFHLKLLPAAAIYGANASGKSNFVKALDFAQKFVTEPRRTESLIATKPFRLDNSSAHEPTRFDFQILIDGTVYQYQFGLTTKRVVSEKLTRITPKEERVLFCRELDEFELDPDVPEKERERAAYKGTHDNDLYLRNSVSQKLNTYRPIYEWFETALILIEPSTVYAGMHEITTQTHPLFKVLKSRLSELDFGISDLRQVKINPELVASKEFLDRLKSLSDGRAVMSPYDESVFLQMEKGNVLAKKISSAHRGEGGQEVLFDFDEESDGTRRLLNLLPAFLMLEELGHAFVIVVDELDRSLHSLLTQALISSYLASRRDSSRSQLIFTTHDLQLMDQALLRRDEMWITDRDSNGASQLIAFSEYKDVRYDKDIRKSYLQGRMGGVPKIVGDLAMSECEGRN